MSHVISKPFDRLVHPDPAGPSPTPDAEDVVARADVVIIGSGYGASVAALQLSGLEKTLANGRREKVRVIVLERGREYSVGEFPNTLGELPGHVRIRGPNDTHPTGNPDALFDLRQGDDLDVLVGNGLGGGSLINANAVIRPDPSVLEAFPEKYRGSRLDHAVEAVERLLLPPKENRPVHSGGEKGEEEAESRGTAEAPRQKYDACERLARELGWSAQFGPAPIAVTQGPDRSTTPNTVGIDQPNCTDCGNCVTGCNIGAKNTLMMNMIPLAHERGAEFYTGANVVRVLKLGGDETHRWRLEVQRTSSIKNPLERERFHVDARYVIVAAGTLGSTEILLRSAETTPGFDLSAKLGSRFSTNGDGIAFSYGELMPVNAIGTRAIHSSKSTGPGPTITAKVQHRFADGSPFTLEDGAIPAPIVKVFGELLTTGAQLGRLGKNQLPTYFEDKRLDPLAYNTPLLDHSQVFLMMTDDGAPRTLRLSTPDTARDATHTCAIPAPLSEEALERADARLLELDRRLTAHDLRAGMGCGQFVQNPGFRLFPAEASSVFGGSLPGRRNVSVHPLGGCPMGTSAENGVVNENGEVFDASSAELHEGLFVMDGAVMPGALCTNPFLTISAVAWECCDVLRARLREDEQWTGPAPGDQRVRAVIEGLLPAPQTIQPDPVAPPRPELIVREQLVGQLIGKRTVAENTRLRSLLGEGYERLFERDGLVIQLETEHVDVYSRFTDRSGPDTTNGRIRIGADVKLFMNEETAEEAERRPRHGAPRTLRKRTPLATGHAQITMLELDLADDVADGRPGDRWGLKHAKRVLGAWWTYLRLRGWPSTGGKRPWRKILADLPDTARGFWNVGAMHARYRQFDYHVAFQLEQPGDALDVPMTLEGRKEIRFAPGSKRLWDSLLALPIEKVTIAGDDPDPMELKAQLHVDASYIFDEGLIQATSSDDMVESAMSAVSFGGWFARCILETGFWEFAAPKYPKAYTRPDLTPPPLRIGPFKEVPPVRFEMPVPLLPTHQRGSPTELPLDLHRYPQKDRQKALKAKPVLLIHGLAQGSGVFTTPHMRCNMASYLWRHGYDVWVVDHRLSNRFDDSEVPYGDWSIDAIGRIDVPAAIERVHAETGGQKVKVFAHCVGAVGVQMAILSGRLTRPRRDAEGEPLRDDSGKVLTESLLESVCFNAIHPWVVPSPTNLARAKLGTYALERFPDSLLDPVFEDDGEPGALRTLFDRAAFSLSRIGEIKSDRGDGGHGRPHDPHQAICDRMTLLYGRMWRHQNLERTVHAHWDELVGRAPAPVYQQLYYMLDRERILDQDGENTYLTADNVRAHWKGLPTLFVHGDWSDVFNPLSATRSAIRLNSILNAGLLTKANGRTKIFHMRIARFGHMDPILGKRAKRESFKWIEKFFKFSAESDILDDEQRFAIPASDDDRRPRRQKVPEVAGAIRAAWIDDATNDIVVRWWLERDRFGSSPPQRAAVWTTTSQLGQFFHVDDSEPSYAWMDERIPRNQGYEIRHLFARRPGDRDSGADLHLVAHSLLHRVGRDGYVGAAEAKLLGDFDPSETQTAAATDVSAVRDARFYQRLAARRDGDAAAEQRFDFIVGSCRYPGTPFEADLADAVFKGMQQRIDSNDSEGHDMAFFIGDQIYADAYNDVFDASKGRERYHGRYHAAFTTPHMAGVLRSLPVHFAIDDHEIVDNWSGCATETEAGGTREIFRPQTITYGRISQEQVDFALKAARLNMSSARSVRPVGRAPQPPGDSLWYELDHEREVAFPCFVLDTRGERELRRFEHHGTVSDGPRMLREDVNEQLDRFVDWLDRISADGSETRGRPKFVFAGQVLAPLRRSFVDDPHTFRSHDGFVGYPRTLARLIEAIAERDVKNIVFVGGDHHMSSLGRLELRTREHGSVTAWQIVASGLYSPMPFTNARPDEYLWNEPWSVEVDSQRGIGFDYRGTWITDSRSHFLEVGVAPTAGASEADWQVRVSAFDAAGKRIESVGRDFDDTADQTRIVFP